MFARRKESWSVTLYDPQVLQVRADVRLKKEFPLITLPVLILHGTADKVTNPKGSQLFYDTAGSTDKTLKLYEGHVHDLLSDYGKEGGGKPGYVNMCAIA